MLIPTFHFTTVKQAVKFLLFQLIIYGCCCVVIIVPTHNDWSTGDHEKWTESLNNLIKKIGLLIKKNMILFY